MYTNIRWTSSGCDRTTKIDTNVCIAHATSCRCTDIRVKKKMRILASSLVRLCVQKTLVRPGVSAGQSGWLVAAPPTILLQVIALSRSVLPDRVQPKRAILLELNFFCFHCLRSWYYERVTIRCTRGSFANFAIRYSYLNVFVPQSYTKREKRKSWLFIVQVIWMA